MNPPPSKLLRAAPHDSPNALESSLAQSFTQMQARLTPPFPLSVPSPTDYTHLTLALAFALLTQPHLSRTHLTHLHSLVTDGYGLFTSTVLSLSLDSFHKLLDTPKSQLLWATDQLVKVSAVKVDSLLVSLLRNITGGDFSEPNLWLCQQILKILTANWEWLVDEPLVLTSSLFVFLRLLADHYRLMGSSSLDELKRMEVEFCVRVLRECFGLCLRIGRDLIRLLQDLVFIPEFKDLWKDLLFDPAKLGVSGFGDIVQLYRMRTPSCYFLLRIGPEMETQLRFLLTNVKWGSQKRYQAWFAKKHLALPGSESVIVDIVRFICCSHHPSNEVIQSNVISRWAAIGWLLKCCRRNYFEANVKLALFYDWLFFDEKVDNIMNIEPAMLLMVNSVPQYVDITQTLMEFLFLLVDNYDVDRKEVIVRGVLASFSVLVKKGVVRSLDPLISCSVLSPVLRERLATFVPPVNPNPTIIVKASPDMCSRQVEVAHAGECHVEVSK